MTDTFLCNLIGDIEAQITAAMNASLELSTDAIESYTFNTGQTTQTVTKANLNDLQKYIDSLLARRDTLRQRCGLDKATFNATPGW